VLDQKSFATATNAALWLVNWFANSSEGLLQVSGGFSIREKAEYDSLFEQFSLV